MSFEEKSCNEYNCILPWDTNRTLKATFEFIKKHQIDENGAEITTSIYMGIASLINLNLSNYNERNIVFNYIQGTVLEVLDNSVIISVKIDCEDKLLPYVLAYSDIQNIQSEIFTKYYEEYLSCMDCLPCLCECKGNRYYDILNALKEKIRVNKNNENLEFYVIYGGIFSRPYLAKELDVVKNLILFRSGIVPITSINGYFTTPILTKTEEKEMK